MQQWFFIAGYESCGATGDSYANKRFINQNANRLYRDKHCLLLLEANFKQVSLGSCEFLDEQQSLLLLQVYTSTCVCPKSEPFATLFPFIIATALQ